MLSLGHILISGFVVTNLFMHYSLLDSTLLGHAFFHWRCFYMRYHHFCKVHVYMVQLSLPHMHSDKPSESSWCASLMCCLCSLAGMCMPNLHATVHMHAKFLSFTCSKHAGTYVYPHACVKLYHKSELLTHKLHKKLKINL